MLTAMVAGLPVFLAYLVTLSPTVPLEDGGEMIRAAFTLGVTHPPGYPLYTLIGRLACLLPLGDPAFRINIMSAFFSACGSAVLAVAVLRLAGKDDSGASGYLAAILSAWLMGTAPALWWQSVIAEKYALNYLFNAVVITAALMCLSPSPRVYGAESGSRRVVLLLGLATGLSASHHGQTSYLVPGVSLVVWWTIRRFPRNRRARATVLLLLMAGVGLSAKFLYPPIRAAQNPLHNWNNPSTAGRFSEYTSGEPYKYRILYWDPAAVVRRSREHARFFPAQFGWPGVAAGILGMALLIRSRPREAVVLLSIVLTGTAYCLNFSLQGIAIRTYYIPVFLAFSLFTSYGLIRAFREVSGRGRTAFPAVLVLTAAWLAWQTGRHGEEADRSRHFFAYDFSRAILRSVPDRCLLIAYQDYDLFPLWYQNDILGVSPRVIVVNAAPEAVPPGTVPPGTGATSVSTGEQPVPLIYPPTAGAWRKRFPYTGSLKGRDPGIPVYFTLVFKEIQDFPCTPRGAAYRYDPGPVSRVPREVREEWIRFRRSRTVRGVFDSRVQKDQNTLRLIGYYAYMDYYRGYLLSFLPEGCSEAVPYYRSALAWPSLPDSRTRAAVHGSYAGCLDALGDSAEAWREAENAVAACPEWIPTLNNLALLHMRHGRRGEALKIFRRALVIDPRNPVAVNGVRLLEGGVAEHRR
jgi:hypothetical protein